MEKNEVLTLVEKFFGLLIDEPIGIEIKEEQIVSDGEVRKTGYNVLIDAPQDIKKFLIGKSGRTAKKLNYLFGQIVSFRRGSVSITLFIKP